MTSPENKNKRKQIIFRVNYNDLEEIDSEYLRFQQDSGEVITKNDFFLRKILGTNENLPRPKRTYRCRFCHRIWTDHERLEEHEKRCAKNPDNKGITVPNPTPPQIQMIQQMLVSSSMRYEDLLGQFSSRIEQQFHEIRREIDELKRLTYNNSNWADLSAEEQKFLLQGFLQANRPSNIFRPVDFKEYLINTGVQFSSSIIRNNQDEVSVFLKHQVKDLLEMVRTGYYRKKDRTN